MILAIYLYKNIYKNVNTGKRYKMQMRRTDEVR